jgi:hypothetical protein
VLVPAVHTEHPRAREIAFSAHSITRFRQRMPIREPGAEAVALALRETLADADISGWPPAWAASDRPAELWAATGDLAFPLAPTPTPGRWLALTCLVRGT